MVRKIALSFIIIVVCASCASTNTKNDIAATKKIITTMEISQRASKAYANDDFELAETLFLQVVKNDQNNSRGWYKLGNIYANSDRLQAAIDAYHNAIDIKPDHQKARHNLGVIYLEQAKTYLTDSGLGIDSLDAAVLKDLKTYLQQLLEQL